MKRPENNSNYCKETFDLFTPTKKLKSITSSKEVEKLNKISLIQDQLAINKTKKDFLLSEEEKLKKQLKDLVLNKFPKQGDTYYIICGSGPRKRTWGNFLWEQNNLRKGLIVETLEEAKLIQNKILAHTSVVNKIKELNNGWKPDWKNLLQDKWTIEYSHIKKDFSIDAWKQSQIQPNNLIMKNKEICETVLNCFSKTTLKLAYGIDC